MALARLGLALACVWSVLLIQSAAVSAKDANRLHEAWEDALEGQEHVLTPQQFAKLNNLAYQAAVVRVCDGFEIDETKFRAQLSEAAEAPHDDSLSDDEHKAHAAFVLIEFGTRYGLLIAEGNSAKGPFCERATAHRKDAETQNVWE